MLFNIFIGILQFGDNSFLKLHIKCELNRKQDHWLVYFSTQGTFLHPTVFLQPDHLSSYAPVIHSTCMFYDVSYMQQFFQSVAPPPCTSPCIMPQTCPKPVAMRSTVLIFLLILAVLVIAVMIFPCCYLWHE